MTKDDKILRDGERRRFPMQCMDAAQRELAERARRANDESLVTDGMGGTLGLHQPGYRLPAPSSTLDRQSDARDRYLNDINHGWQPKPAA